MSFRARRRYAAAFLLSLLLSLQAMVALPGLHAWFHPDASDPDHECAVTLFAHGQVEAASPAVAVQRAPERLIVSDPLPSAIFVSADFRLLPSRGPPASLALV